MNILVIAPHPDDETIGCGGSLLLHSAAGDRVAAVWLTSGELGLKRLDATKARQIREREARRAGALLGLAELIFLGYPDWAVAQHQEAIQQDLVSILKRIAPDTIYLPHPLDDHPDHQPVSHLVKSAIQKGALAKPELRGYEVWSPLPRVDYTVDITQVMIRKVRALRAHRSQLQEFHYVRAMRGLNQFRGALAGKCPYAEVFEDLSFHRTHP
jgi:LmbE family N-acetylglucosaminyl deacetylase